MEGRPARRTVVCAVPALLFLSAICFATTQDPIDRLIQRAPAPPGASPHHAYSDFTDPLGRFMDFLAAGAFADARAMQPQACAAWLATRTSSPLSGRFRVWDTDLDLDALCPPR
jgi:hypothetical protein